ncbi:unnamed protein product [Anisakis simplex]|uniref:Secreted protein n=1 Tax=Anisakis simplex TaxID=6269 RepID=A0A0M3IY69_ANISI|nr:unnamed protein product [Anisakis simplex]
MKAIRRIGRRLEVGGELKAAAAATATATCLCSYSHTKSTTTKHRECDESLLSAPLSLSPPPPPAAASSHSISSGQCVHRRCANLLAYFKRTLRLWLARTVLLVLKSAVIIDKPLYGSAFAPTATATSDTTTNNNNNTATAKSKLHSSGRKVSSASDRLKWKCKFCSSSCFDHDDDDEHSVTTSIANLNGNKIDGNIITVSTTSAAIKKRKQAKKLNGTLRRLYSFDFSEH